jgi:hypothetical protein
MAWVLERYEAFDRRLKRDPYYAILTSTTTLSVPAPIREGGMRASCTSSPWA